MRVYVKRNKRLRIVATTRPERNLLKHFSNKEPRIVGFSSETVGVDNEETEVTLEISFRTLAKPQELLSQVKERGLFAVVGKEDLE